MKAENMATSEKPIIVVGGCPRSGTTLLRLILDSHRNIACGPELKYADYLKNSMVKSWKAHGRLMEENYGITLPYFAQTFGLQYAALLEPYRIKAGKARIAEKTPQNILSFPALAMMLPKSPMVHMIRDGRDVASSLVRQKWVHLGTTKKLAYTQDIKSAAEYWARCVRTGRTLSGLKVRYTEIRYEDLVNKPESTLRYLLDRLNEPWDPSVLDYQNKPHHLPRSEQRSHGDSLKKPINPEAIGRWRDWSAAERSEFKAAAGELLIELGYAQDDQW
jgi:protein-tyrosine sulfotransferase